MSDMPKLTAATQPTDRDIMHSLDGPIADKLTELRRQIGRYLGWDALWAASTWCVIMYWCTLALDYLPVRWAGADETPRPVRAALLLITMAGVAWVVYQRLLRPWLRKPTASQMALLLERRFPVLSDSLITAVELHHQQQSAATATMLLVAVRQAEKHLQQLHVRDVLDYRPLRRGAALAVACLASLLVFACLVFPTFWQSVTRFYLLSNRPWPRRTALEAVGFVDQQKKVARGEDLVLQVRAKATLDVPPPDVCYVYYETDDGDQGRATLTPEGSPRDGYQYYQYADRPFRGVLSDVHFEVVGGDFRLRDHHVRALDSPAFVDPQLEITPPRYTGLTARREAPRDGLRLPQGTHVTFRSDTNRPIESVKITDGSRGTDTVVQVPATPAPFLSDLGILTEPLRLDLQITDRDGLRSRDPYRIALAIIPDEPPAVEVAYRGIGSAITPFARLPLQGKISDDYGLTNVTLQARWEQEAGEPKQVESEPWSAPLPANEPWTASLDLQEPPAHWPAPLTPGAKLTLTVRAFDNCQLTEQPHRTEFSLGTLDVVRREELLAILEGRELALRRRFEQLVQEMEEARDTLVRLRTDLANDAERTTGWEDAQELRMRRVDSHARRAAPELEGMALSYSDIWLELQNNRVNTPELEERIREQLANPLEQLAQQTFTAYAVRVQTLRNTLNVTSKLDAPTATNQCAAALEDADLVLLAMRDILSRMLQLEDFNELIEMVRDMLQSQEGLRQETEQKRKESLLELLE